MLLLYFLHSLAEFSYLVHLQSLTIITHFKFYQNKCANFVLLKKFEQSYQTCINVQAVL